jgi:hypothetical protein
MSTTTNSLTTIPSSPAAPAPATPPAGEGEGAPPEPSAPAGTPEGASGAGAPPESGTSTDTTEAQHELARKFEALSRSERAARKRESSLHAREQAIGEQEKEIASLKSELEAALEDPVAYYINKGKDPVEIAKRFAKPMSAEEKRLKAIEDKIEADAKAAKEAEEEWKKRTAAENKTKMMRRFVSEITSDECPNLTSLYDAHEVPALLENMLKRPLNPGDPRSPSLLKAFQEEHGRNPTNAELRRALEADAESRATRLQKRQEPAGQQAPPTPAAETDQLPPPAPPATSGPSSISNRHAASTSTGKKPLSFEEKRKQNRDALKKQLEAETGSGDQE